MIMHHLSRRRDGGNFFGRRKGIKGASECALKCQIRPTLLEPSDKYSKGSERGWGLGEGRELISTLPSFKLSPNNYTVGW